MVGFRYTLYELLAMDTNGWSCTNCGQGWIDTNAGVSAAVIKGVGGCRHPKLVRAKLEVLT